MAKYDSLRKLSRNRLLIEYCQTHPEASLKEIGALFNISPQRVYQIFKYNTDKKGDKADG